MKGRIVPERKDVFSFQEQILDYSWYLTSYDDKIKI